MDACETRQTSWDNLIASEALQILTIEFGSKFEVRIQIGHYVDEGGKNKNEFEKFCAIILVIIANIN